MIDYSPRERRRLLRQRRRRLPPKPPELDGIFLLDPDTHREVFVPFDLLHSDCRESMRDEYIRHFERHGIYRWNKDPSYNWGKKKP